MKKLVSVLLAAALIFSTFCVSAMAETGSVLYGDVNDDSKVNSADALLILQYATSLKTLTSTQKILGDVDMDGKVNSSDALCVLQFSTEKLASFARDYSKTLKYNNVDKVVNAGTYTIQAKAVIEGTDTTMTFTSNGKESTVSTSVEMSLEEQLSPEELAEMKKENPLLFAMLAGRKIPMEIRFYTDRNGKCYIIIPLLFSYCEVEPDNDLSKTKELVSILFSTENIYVKTAAETKNGKSYTCETYLAEPDTQMKYYFSGNSLKLIGLSQGETNMEYTIEKFTASATADLLKIPDNCIENRELANMF